MATISPIQPPAASALPKYPTPVSPQELAERLGIPLAQIIKLDANESPYGPAPSATRALAELVANGLSLPSASRYPDPASETFRAALARYTGVPASQIVPGNGSDELIRLLGAMLLSPDDEVIYSEPTFAAYRLTTRRQGARAVDVPREADLTVSREKLLAAMGPRTRMVFLCAPNNPTGTPMEYATMLAVLERAEALAREKGVSGVEAPLVIVDEAYYEVGTLAGDARVWTAAPLIAEHPQVVALRTFSKLFGLAGLRVGYALCAPKLAERLRIYKDPYNVNIAGMIAAQAALDDLDWLREKAVALFHERERLARELGALPGQRVYPSAANLLLVEFEGATPEEAVRRRDAVWEGLQDHGILVRRFPDPLMATRLRVSIGRPEQDDALLTVWRELVE